MNLETKITIYKFTPQVFTLTRYLTDTALFVTEILYPFILWITK